MLKVTKDFDINSLTRLANEELRLGLDVDALEMVFDFLNDVYYGLLYGVYQINDHTFVVFNDL